MIEIELNHLHPFLAAKFTQAPVERRQLAGILSVILACLIQCRIQFKKSTVR